MRIQVVMDIVIRRIATPVVIGSSSDQIVSGGKVERIGTVG